MIQPPPLRYARRHPTILASTTNLLLFLLSLAIVTGLSATHTLASSQFTASNPQYLLETLIRPRDQDPGSGTQKDQLPPGVKPIPNVPFAGNDSLPYSPPFYPTPQLQAEGPWADSIARAQAYLSNWTIEEQIELVTGAGWQSGLCVGNIAPNKKRGFKGLCLQDSPTGVRFADLVNVFPAGITAAATFDSTLAFKRGEAMGKEFRAKGVNIALGPGMNHLRVAAGGRNWEMSGADPYLNGEGAYHTIRGLQSQGVQACAKHIVGNEQEHYRSASSSNIDERTLREIYLHPFLRAIQADVASMMCSYNLLNNTYACENSYLMNDILKGEMGFKGFVMSDWGAQHSTVESANGGLDMSMPGDLVCCNAHTGEGVAPSFWRGNLSDALTNGDVNATRLKDMGVRILAPYFHFGQDKETYPRTNFDSFDRTSPANEHVNVNKLYRHAPLIREIAAAGTVLVKNSKRKGSSHRALPLKRGEKTPNHIALVGSPAGPAFKGANFYADRSGTDGVLGVGWGSGTADYSILISPYEAIQHRAARDGTALSWNFNDYNYNHTKEKADERVVDVALVFLQSDSGEEYLTVDGNGGDRNNLTAWHEGNRLVREVASVNSNTIVVIQNPAQVDVEAFIENDNVTAVLIAHMGGREAGNAIVDVLYGDYVPSGRLPYTVAKNRTDYPAELTYLNESSTQYVQINYTEGVLTDYRWFDRHNLRPRFEFGFGLSYSSFQYGAASGHWLAAFTWEELYTPPHRDGGGLPAELFQDVYEFSFSLTNTGEYDAHEVPQAYLHLAGEKVKVLRKFQRIWLRKGQTKKITWRLNRYDLSRWDTVKGSWVKPTGAAMDILIGQSSRKIRRRIEML